MVIDKTRPATQQQQTLSGTEALLPPRAGCTPPLRWVGSKRWLVPFLAPAIYERLAVTRGRYIEPFLGGGAIALDLGLPNMLLGDTCKPLIITYQAIRKSPRAVASALKALVDKGTDKESYLRVRAEESRSPVIAAARFLYLNRFGFNGLYRENRKGKFNVPHGGDRSAAGIPDAEALTAVAHALRGADLRLADFYDTIAAAQDGDVVYCFTPGASVLCNDEDYVPIEDIQVGDRLWGARRVERVIRRKYEGCVYRMKIQGSPFTLSITEEHPVLSIPGRPKDTRQDVRTASDLATEMAFRPARELQVGDYVLMPSTSTQEHPVDWAAHWPTDVAPQAIPVELRPNDAALGELIGFYAAEGHVEWAHGRPCTAIWSFGRHETGTHAARVARLCREVFHGATVTVHEGCPHETATQVKVTSTYVARFIYSLALGQVRSRDPAKRYTRQLHPVLMIAPKNVQLRILYGWLAGDGGTSSVIERGKTRLTGTGAALRLILQMYRMAQRCDFRPSWKRRGNNADVDFTIAEDVDRLGFPTALRIRQTCAQRRFIGDYLAVRIKEITELSYAGEVFNLEVDGDHKICVDGVISHNCDSPYYDTFSNYTAGGFSEEDHTTLAEALRAAYARGATVVASNSDGERIRELYNWAFVTPVHERHLVGATADRRGLRDAVLIVSDETILKGS